jgi:Calcineurin-like phosphoesterase/Purple acid Phosphatase, N-terminal domain
MPSMRSFLCAAALAAATAACVKGNPDRPDAGVATYHGGSITPEGCTYQVTTREGAEAPTVATDEVGSDPTPKQVRLGLAGDAKTTMVVSWRTADETTKATTVRWGEGSALDHTTTGLTFAYSGAVSGKGSLIRMHETHLCGLAPDTSYSYQVGSVDAGGAEHFSPTYSFRTAPDVVAHPDTDVVIGVIGDSRDGYDVQKQLVDQLAGKMPDLLLFSGDAVTLGQIQPEWEQFFDALEPLVQSVPMVSAHGNHEVMAINYFAQLALPGDEENYGLDYGWMHLTVLNDSPSDAAQLTTQVTPFLQKDLTASDSARWKIVMHHRPAYSSATAHGSDPMLQQLFVPIFDQHHVDLVFNGHDHDYERSHPLFGGSPVDAASGTVYIVDGGLGAELYDNVPGPTTAKAEKTHSAFVVHLRKDMMTAEVFRPDGSMVDSFNETKPAL